MSPVEMHRNSYNGHDACVDGPNLLQKIMQAFVSSPVFDFSPRRPDWARMKRRSSRHSGQRQFGFIRSTAFYDCPVEIEDVDGATAVTSLCATVRHAYRDDSRLESPTVDVFAALNGGLRLAAFESLHKRVCETGKTHRGALQVEFPWPQHSAGAYASQRRVKNAVVQYTSWSRNSRELWISQQFRADETMRCQCGSADHDQIAEVSIQLQVRAPVAISEITAAICRSSACEIYGLLKPASGSGAMDTLTNVKFVEEIAQDIYLELTESVGVRGAYVRFASIESTHNYRGIAEIGDHLDASECLN